jgi:uncharacterized protein YqeY
MPSELKMKFNEMLHESMKSHDEITRNTMRMVLTALKMAEVEKKEELEDAAVMSLVQKEIKSRRESIIDFKKGNREDLVESTEKEIKVLEQFLPKQLSDDELKAIVDSAIQETGASTPTDMGKVMKIAIPKTQGKASSDRISAMVKELLQN